MNDGHGRHSGTPAYASSILVLAFGLSTALLAFAWPDDWQVHLPLQALMGPWLAIRLGGEYFGFGFIGLLTCGGLVLPSCFKSSRVAFALMTAGGVGWIFVGVVAGGVLSA